MDIGNKIQKIRAEQGMTQAEFADKFHVSRQTVSNWENNKNYPDLSILRSISDEYAISFDTLLKDDVEYISHIDNANDRAIKATRWLRIVVPVAIVLLVITAAVAVHQSKRGTYESSALPGIEDKDYVYPKNENGQTYGPDWMGAGEGYEEHAPDLIAASGVNGKQGYVKRTDLDNLDGSPVSTPEEADEYMERKNQRNGKNYYIVIPVFAEDGVTEIDQFWIYNGTGKYGPGSKGDTAIVPDLTGMTKDDAVAALKEVGLELGNITYVISDNEKGVVENQDPPAGTNLGSGSSVDITINGE